MSNPAEANRSALDRLKAAITAKRKADEALVGLHLDTRTTSSGCP